MPATAVVCPSVLLTDSAAVDVIAVVSVAALSALFVSVTPAGAETVAVFTTEPTVEPAIVPVTVNCTDPLTPRSTVALMLPATGPAVSQWPPAPAAHVQVAPSSAAGSVSTTTASDAHEGPALVTTIVYVSTSSGLAMARPSVLVIDRSTCGVNGSLSVAVLLPTTGSVTPTGTATVAVLSMLPIAPAVTVPLTV